MQCRSSLIRRIRPIPFYRSMTGLTQSLDHTLHPTRVYKAIVFTQTKFRAVILVPLVI